MIQVPMPKHKSSRCENKQIGKEVEVKTRYFAATAEAFTKQNSDSNMLKMHPKAAIKSDQTLDCFKHQRRNQNNW